MRLLPHAESAIYILCCQKIAPKIFNNNISKKLKSYMAFETLREPDIYKGLGLILLFTEQV